MHREDLTTLLNNVASGITSVDEACEELANASVAELGYATLDLDRGARQGADEVVYGSGKTATQIAGIIRELHFAGQQRILITRVDADKNQEVVRLLADEAPKISIDYHAEAHIQIVGDIPNPNGLGTIAVVCAGTSDLYAAEEAALTARFLGNEVVRLYDVGVAGLHRLLRHADDLARAQVIIAVAGMEGALPSVIAGLTQAPVIAVPTSVGYGASFGGIAALLGMLNSCGSGVSVVNIDNGFGAGFQASLINHLAKGA